MAESAGNTPVKAEPAESVPKPEPLLTREAPSPEDKRNRPKSEDLPSDAKPGHHRRSPERAIFVGNFPPSFCTEDIEQLFVKHGKVSRVDKKQNFAFVFMPNSQDAEAAIDELSGKSIGRPPRTLRVEWSRGDGAVRRREVARRSRNLPPNETLFVVNYDPEKVVQKDLEDLFKTFGRIVRIELHGQFTFVQYETIDMAADALNALHGAEFKNRNLIVEYTIRKDASSSRSSRYDNHGPPNRGYPARPSYPPQPYPNGGYGAPYAPYNRGGYGAPPYPPTNSYFGYPGSGGGHPSRYDRAPSYGRPSRKRNDDFGWSAAVSDRRNKRPLSPRRSLSPRRGETDIKERKERRSRSRSRSRRRSRSPSPKKGRAPSRSPSPKKRRTSISHSPSPKKRRSSKDDVHRSRSRSPVRRSKDARDSSRSPSPVRRERSPSPVRRSPSPKPKRHDRSSSPSPARRGRSSSSSPKPAPRDYTRSPSPRPARVRNGKSLSPSSVSPPRRSRKRSRSPSADSHRSSPPASPKRAKRETVADRASPLAASP